MADCRVCGQPAGLFRRVHPECEHRHAVELTKISNLVTKAVREGANADAVLEACAQARDLHISAVEAGAAVITGWEQAVDAALEDGILGDVEEHNLATLANQLQLSQNDLDRNGAHTRVVKAGVLRDLVNGKMPTRLTVINEPLPFNFQKGEQLIWLFTGVEYLEDRVRRTYVGSSQGLSFRIAKGVYYRVGSFRGHPVERTQRESIDRGLLGVTTKHIYFAGSVKSFRVRHDKIVSHVPYSDGVAIVRDAATAKPQVFVTGDGWFTMNLLTNVSNL